MTMKSLLLGAAAGIAAIGAAQAADLPMTKGESVEYVKVCSAFGEGFFYIPGSDTCLKIGGEIRADYRVFGGDRPVLQERSGRFNRDDNRSGFNTEARIWFDARTQTDWGLLRSYFQIDADTHPIKGSAAADAADASGRGTSNIFTIDKAFIQFGGLTAGYAHSFFGFYDNEYGDTIWAPYYADSKTTNLIAYTAQFGGGLNATLALEDGRDHRASISNTGFTQGGQQAPDIVGQVRWDQDWGTLAVQAAGHQVRSGALAVDEDGIILPGQSRQASKYGWALGGDALFKIPYLDGGHFIVEGQYADGATDYLGAANSVLGTTDYFRTSLGSLEAGKGWSVVAELGGNLSPQWGFNLVGSYIDTSYDNALVNANGAPVDFGIKEYTLTGNLTYTIVKGLSITGEVVYTHVAQDNGIGIGGVAADPTATPPVTGSAPTSFRDDKANIWQAGIRIRRVF